MFDFFISCGKCSHMKHLCNGMKDNDSGWQLIIVILKVKVMLGAYTIAVHIINAHLHCVSPWTRNARVPNLFYLDAHSSCLSEIHCTLIRKCFVFIYFCSCYLLLSLHGKSSCQSGMCTVLSLVMQGTNALTDWQYFPLHVVLMLLLAQLTVSIML